MSYGKLEFILFLGEEALPVTEAEILIINKDTSQIINNTVLRPDQNGKTKAISLYTYEKYLSQEPEATIPPYKNYDAIIFSNSFENIFIENIPIFSGITSIQKIELTPKIARSSSLKVINIPPNALISDNTPLLDNIDNNVENPNVKLLSKVVIPPYITIHLGSPSSYAQNVTVPFTDYIKNVASSEIYPTWPMEAIKSNIIAQISFTLNRIYTEWYRSRGYDFDITNSTAYDHYYVNGRNIFDTINDAVDEIFDDYISKKDFKEPLLAQYCNGTTVTCSGLSQWGTVTYANNGLSYFEILKKYYGTSIELRNAPFADGIIESYPGKALRQGDKGEDVKIIQVQLNRIRKNYPGIPVIPKEDGYFDEATKNSVKTFQKVFNLTSDGIVGKQTWYKISQLYVGVKKLAELNSEGEEIKVPTTPPKKVIKLGDKGDDVKLIQYLLSCIAAFYDNILPTSISGDFNEETQNSVKSFQQAFNLIPDGIVGILTWEKLIEIYKVVEPYIKDASGTNIQYPGHIFKKGSKGENVRLIQTWINGIHSIHPVIPTLNVDGIYGTNTKNSVMLFQRLNGLIDDGIVGKLTWDKLYTVYKENL